MNWDNLKYSNNIKYKINKQVKLVNLESNKENWQMYVHKATNLSL